VDEYEKGLIIMRRKELMILLRALVTLMPKTSYNAGFKIITLVTQFTKEEVLREG